MESRINSLLPTSSESHTMGSHHLEYCFAMFIFAPKSISMLLILTQVKPLILKPCLLQDSHNKICFTSNIVTLTYAVFF